MKRPLLAVGLTFTVVTWASFFLPDAAIILSAVCAAAGICIFLLRKSSVALPVILLSAAVAFGAHALYMRRAVRPLYGMAGETVVAHGIITASAYDPPAQTITLRASFPQNPELPSTYLNVQSYGGEQEYFTGDAVRCRVRLERLRGAASYYNSRGIYMSARLIGIEPRGGLTRAEALTRFFLRLRAGMLRNIHQNLPGTTAGVMAAMTLDERSALDAGISSALTRSGTVHILSVSGLHLSVIVGALIQLLRRLRVPRVPQSLLAALAAVVFAFLVGFSPPIIRALVMTLVVLASQVFSRRSDILNSLGLAMLLICIFAPSWTLNGGFWLSTSSTAGIGVLYPPLAVRIENRYASAPRPLRAAARIFLGTAAVSAGAYLFSMPFLLLLSGWVPLLSLPANFLISPFVTPALLFGMLCALSPGGALISACAWAANFCTKIILELSGLISNIPFSVFAFDELWKLIWFLTAAVTAGFLLRIRADKSLWKYGAALMAFAFAVGGGSCALAQRDKIELITIDRCSAAILLRGGSAVVVGTPNVYEISSLLRYLDFRGVKKLDAVIANDCGEQIGSGIIQLIRKYNSRLIIGPDDAYILQELADAMPGVEVLSSGYATVTVLGGANITTSLTDAGARIVIGGKSIVKSRGEYDIIESAPPGGALIRRDGALIWTKQTPPAFEPVGALLFGECRLVLDI